MSTAIASRSNGTVKVLGILIAIAGAIMIIAGGVTWGAVTSNLSQEKITVSGDSPNFAGAAVNSPWTAFAQAQIIRHHAMESSDNQTYAELGAAITAKQNELKDAGKSAEDIAKDADVIALQQQRTTVMNGSFLRASLFTSVVSFGVAFFAFGVGVVSILVGWALVKLASPAAATPAPAAAQSTPVSTAV
jgi:hypothetical protein